MSIPQPPRRKGPKNLPTLPLSAFSPPNSGTSESFPLPPSPSLVHPASVVDANVIPVKGDLSLAAWKSQAGDLLAGRMSNGGVVLSLLSADGISNVIKEVESSADRNQIVSLVLPFDIDNPDTSLEAVLSNSSVPISLSTVFTKSTPEAVAGLRWALERNRPVDIDIQATLSDSVLEGFEDMLTKATADLENTPPIILSNILPPPHDLDLPIVKLMNHPTYLAFQAQTAALSLFANVYIKYLPPVWNATTPHTPLPGTASSAPAESDLKQQREWKRRIKMYLGPVMEAFGYERIVFGSSPSPLSKASSNVGDWYELARESLAELGVEQEFVNAVFGGNAKTVYGSK
ncbi:hypothetical protein BDQ12DRAFT_717949 [Crucibulum laeve]|uniref:Amidohydrolase-related domain-containing protein n=1 Tax=Crucibulum laeve TaxID=68775 RepID=A0A5C3MHZ9_9AGAR|nr:hypothetical protein BDQ12DRAFT_717949 [Crucibulum laeve]